MEILNVFIFKEADYGIYHYQLKARIYFPYINRKMHAPIFNNNNECMKWFDTNRYNLENLKNDSTEISTKTSLRVNESAK